MKKIIIDEDQAVTLADLAKDLAKSHGWKDHAVEGDEIQFQTQDGEWGVVDTSGFARKKLDGGEFEDWDDENVDWDEEFDGWSNHVWAEDEDGATVMLHD